MHACNVYCIRHTRAYPGESAHKREPELESVREREAGDEGERVCARALENQNNNERERDRDREREK